MAHVTFIHGIANKPEGDALLRIWLQALAHSDGLDLGAEGVTTSMIYWADVMYDKPMPDDGSYESAADPELESLRQEGVTAEAAADWRAELSPSERAQVEALARELGADEPDGAPQSPVDAPLAPGLERVPLPWSVKKPMMERLLRDVHHYLFNTSFSPRPGTTYAVQDEIRARTLQALKDGSEQAGDGAHVVVSHSMGTVIAYDCLKRVDGCTKVSGLMTVGSPLGLDEVQDMMQPGWSRQNGFPADRVAERWVNVFDHLDPVAGFDPHLANDFRREGAAAVEDINEQNWGLWRHSATKYLKGAKLRRALAEMLHV